MRIYSIYLITNIVNQKRYVGFTSRRPQQRWSDHKVDAANPKRGSVLHKAMRKYGIENFLFEVIYCSKEKDYIISMEEFFIREYDTITDNGKGYNCTYGGEFHEVSQISREKMAIAKDGKLNHFYGKKHNEDSKRKMSDSLTGTKKNISDETKAALLIYRSNRVISDETRNAMSLGQRGRKHSEETKEKMSVSNASSKKIKINGKEYKSMREASIDLNISYAALGNVLRGTTPNFNNLRWEFI